jgi:Family of unknown function (DUF6510)
MTHDDRHVDGNAVGGVLMDVFGREMTTAVGTCASCGAVNPLGAVIAYTHAPGDVLACPGCGAVLLVAVHLRQGYRVTIESLRSFEVAELTIR